MDLTPDKKCGLARESAESDDINVAWHTVFASKPAPTVIAVG
jgi:hypothetical protein